MIRREDLTIAKLKEFEQSLINDLPTTDQEKIEIQCDIEYKVTIDKSAMELIHQYINAQPYNLNFFKKKFADKYAPMKIAKGPEKIKSRFYKVNDEICYDITFEEFHIQRPPGLFIPPEFLIEVNKKKSLMTFKLTKNGYEFIHLHSAPKFKMVFNEYFFKDRTMCINILEQAETLTVTDLANIREHLFRYMKVWKFPDEENDGINDIDYEKPLTEIIKDMPSHIKFIVKHIYLLDKSLRHSYEADMKEKGKTELSWEDTAYFEQLSKILVVDIALLNVKRTAKLFALFACFDDDIGIVRPTAVIGAVAPLYKFANAIGNLRRIKKCDAKDEKNESEQIAGEDLLEEVQLINQLNIERERLFESKKSIFFFTGIINGILSNMGIFGGQSNNHKITHENNNQPELRIRTIPQVQS